MITKGAIELAPPSPGYYSHRFVVWKATGSWRPVIDLSHLHRFVQLTRFKMETNQSVLHAVRRDNWTFSIDLKDAYLQVPIHPNNSRYLRFVADGKVCQFKALCFSLSTAPQVFTRVMTPASVILQLREEAAANLETPGEALWTAASAQDGEAYHEEEGSAGREGSEQKHCSSSRTTSLSLWNSLDLSC